MLFDMWENAEKVNGICCCWKSHVTFERKNKMENLGTIYQGDLSSISGAKSLSL